MAVLSFGAVGYRQCLTLGTSHPSVQVDIFREKLCTGERLLLQVAGRG